MNLDEYLVKLKHPRDHTLSMTMKEFASKLGVTSVYLSNIRTGRYKCSTKLAIRIEEVTAGQISSHELMQQKVWKARHNVKEE